MDVRHLQSMLWVPQYYLVPLYGMETVCLLSLETKSCNAGTGRGLDLL